MFRSLILFPSSIEGESVERLLADEIAPAFRENGGLISLHLSVGPLMGPGARDGARGSVMEATFETLDAALSAIMAPAFDATRTKVESLGADILLFEIREP